MGWSAVMKHIFNQISPISICKTSQWCSTIREPIYTAHLSQICFIEKILICMTLEKKLRGKNEKKGYSSPKERVFRSRSKTNKQTNKAKQKTKPNEKLHPIPKFPWNLNPPKYPTGIHPTPLLQKKIEQ